MGTGNCMIPTLIPLWGSSSAGRAPRSQCGGRGFDPLSVHHFKMVRQRSGLFLFCLRANAGGAFWVRTKGGHRAKCSISGLTSFFVLSVLCFCEGRPSHAPFIWCGFRAGRMNRMLPGQWRPNRSRLPGNPLCLVSGESGTHFLANPFDDCSHFVQKRIPIWRGRYVRDWCGTVIDPFSNN